MCSVLEVERENARRGRKKRVHTEGAEKEHRDHREEKPKSTGKSACATRSQRRKMFVIGLKA